MDEQIFDNRVRNALNILYFHIDKDSDKTLLIFKNEKMIKEYKRKSMVDAEEAGCDLRHLFENQIFITERELFYDPNALTGRRFERFIFVWE